MAMFFTVLVVGVVMTGALTLRAHQQRTSVAFVARGQSVQFARSGLVESIGWLRKQTAQPVTDFEPRLDASATPPLLDTIDSDIGIAREFRITNSVWGRYEVWKDWTTDPDPDRLAFRQQMQCEDVSTLRGNLSPGSVWRLRSIGYVYRRVDPTVRFDEAPNQMLAKQVLEAEARRLALLPPGQSALCARNGSGIRVLTRGRVFGGTAAAGLFYESGTPTISGTGATVIGGQTAWPSYDDSFEAVFGVAQAELGAMADYFVTQASDFPSPVPVNALVLCTTGMTFTAARPLKGTGVVAIVGNTTIGQGSYSAFSGLLYVVGNLTIREPSEIQGAVVVTGSVTVEGASDYATITYDDTILAGLRHQLGTYRLSSTLSRPLARDR